MREKIYEKNLSLIKKRYPYLLQYLEEEAPYEWKKEAFSLDEEKIKRAEAVIVLGFHEEGIKKILSIKKRIPLIIIEHNVGRFQYALKNTPLSSILKEKVELWIKGAPSEALRALLLKHFPERMVTNIAVCINQSSLKENPSYYEKVLSELKAIMQRCLVNIAIQWRKGAYWRRRMLSNLHYIIESPPIQTLYGAFKEKPALIVAAGPSLDKNILDIKDALGRALIISVDTAFPILLSRNIKPHIVVSIDSSMIKYNYYFKGKDTEGFYLIGALDCPPILLKKFKKRLFICSYPSPLMAWLAKFVGFKSFFSTGGDVTTAALHIAYEFGANPIILVGLDLAYTQERTYAEGVPKEWHSLSQLRRKHALWIDAVDGGKVMTDWEMFTRIKWMEEYLTGKNLLCIDATEGGALKKGTKIMKLKDAIREYCKKDFDPFKILNDTHNNYKAPSHHALLKEVRRLKPSFQYVKELAERGLNLAEMVKKVEGRRREQIFLMLRSLFKEIMSKEKVLFLNLLDVEVAHFFMKEAVQKNPYILLSKRYKEFFKRMRIVCGATISGLESAERKICKIVDRHG